MAPPGLYIVLTSTPDSDPWGKYHAARGRAELASAAPGPAAAARPVKGDEPVAPGVVSPAVIAALNAAAARPVPRSTAAPFIAAMQEQAAAEDRSRARWRRWLRVTLSR